MAVRFFGTLAILTAVGFFLLDKILEEIIRENLSNIGKGMPSLKVKDKVKST